jgi:hypothetical protein
MNLKREVMRRFGMWLLFAIPLVCLTPPFLYLGGTQSETFRPAFTLILQVFILCALAVWNLIYSGHAGARAEGLVAFGADDEEERAAVGSQVFVDAAGERAVEVARRHL